MNTTFETLKGKTIKEITGAHAGSDNICFILNNGETYKMYHEQDCCEFVSVEDIIGDING